MDIPNWHKGLDGGLALAWKKTRGSRTCWDTRHVYFGLGDGREVVPAPGERIIMMQMDPWHHIPNVHAMWNLHFTKSTCQNNPPRSYFEHTAMLRRHDFNRMWGRRKSSLIWQVRFRHNWCLRWSLSPPQILSGQFLKWMLFNLPSNVNQGAAARTAARGKQSMCHGKILTWSFVKIPTSCFQSF